MNPLECESDLSVLGSILRMCFSYFIWLVDWKSLSFPNAKATNGSPGPVVATEKGK